MNASLCFLLQSQGEREGKKQKWGFDWWVRESGTVAIDTHRQLFSKSGGSADPALFDFLIGGPGNPFGYDWWSGQQGDEKGLRSDCIIGALIQGRGSRYKGLDRA